ncbi:hypothetical protein EWD09_02160 [Salmonella enterica subsp. enterica serovar Newport]|mgnify:CR=1 FL=1|uniref:Uncharacterized protein n=3 Tax=Salmonella enterica TaxID=28901 RepID=A0A5V3MSA9_SALER|nr:MULTISPECIES: hypothetical protein [Enterobacteriaceae]EAA1051418.1 hypothetical protein [Salmonella enterica subsp. enterica serovar Newport]EAA5357436.1 hypothetical protein [Salmonella enterica subsp. enterica serovar Virchow]EAB5475796.1 hypothetical protein [Salmonella enterica subsp. enterica serovar Chester]EAQ0355470.1 hypothetical protein [Salmonella enterica]EBU7937692.1 hypothetical protein [Salmonella enterica subsp. enterica serovar Chittagong]EBV2492925.1 hypothetical protein
MITLVCVIWSVIGIGIIVLSLFTAISNAITEAKNKDDDIISLKRRLFKIESKLDVDCDDY